MVKQNDTPVYLSMYSRLCPLCRGCPMVCVYCCHCMTEAVPTEFDSIYLKAHEIFIFNKLFILFGIKRRQTGILHYESICI